MGRKQQVSGISTTTNNPNHNSNTNCSLSLAHRSSPSLIITFTLSADDIWTRFELPKFVRRHYYRWFESISAPFASLSGKALGCHKVFFRKSRVIIHLNNKWCVSLIEKWFYKRKTNKKRVDTLLYTTQTIQDKCHLQIEISMLNDVLMITNIF